MMRDLWAILLVSSVFGTGSSNVPPGRSPNLIPNPDISDHPHGLSQSENEYFHTSNSAFPISENILESQFSPGHTQAIVANEPSPKKTTSFRHLKKSSFTTSRPSLDNQESILPTDTVPLWFSQPPDWFTHATAQSGNPMTCTSEKEVCLRGNYSRFQLPNKGKQTTVSIGFDGFDVRKIDDIEYTVEISCYFLTKWRDDRLILHSDILRTKYAANPNEEVEEQWFPIDLEFVSKIWLPDVEVLNLKKFQSLDVLSKLQGLWVSQHSNILYVLATRITFICAMSFDAFPLDTQTCLLQVGSFNFDNRKMVFDSYLLPVMQNHTKSILDYDVEISELRSEATFFVPAETGNYSVTGFEMTLTRRMSHYMITYYLPSSLFVVVSWTSFLIPSEDIQGRMALLVTLFLVLVNIFNTTTTNSPKADGLNAMQSWVICCIFFVFGALFEYAIILLQMKVKTFRKLVIPLQKDETCKLDMAVLIAFPIVFLIFNVAYWAAFHF